MHEPMLSTPSALNSEIMQAIERVTNEFWPGIPVIPVMSTGGTDGGIYVGRSGNQVVYGLEDNSSNLFLSTAPVVEGETAPLLRLRRSVPHKLYHPLASRNKATAFEELR